MTSRLAIALFGIAAATACSSHPGTGAETDANTGRLDGADTHADASSHADAATADADVNPSGYRTSLGACWTDAACQRALVIAHGGAWVLVDPPYGTSTAYQDAYTQDADAIKADVRFSSDGVPVVVHSSPFAAYEIDPLDFSCLGATVENMTVAEIVECQWVNGDYIQRLDDLLAWAKGKMIVMLTVKVDATVPQSIAAVIANNATDYAFLELDLSAMTTIVPTATGKDQVYYLVEAASQSNISTLLALHNPRLFMIEDANSNNFGGLPNAQVASIVTTQLHPANVRSFTSVTGVTATAADHEALWNEGFDVVMTNSYASGYTGRVAINTARGISPP